jgi:hypothetical protein
MTRMTPRGCAAAMLLAAGVAHAEDDATHGRFDGDLAVAGAVGATFGPRAPRATADVRLRYLSTAGLFATYEDAPLVGVRSEPRRVIACGLELRPLFLGRWATGREIGSPYADLIIDSLALELGAAFVQPDGARLGPGLQAGLGLELPVFPRASGPFVSVHGGVRFSETALSGGPLAGASDRAMYLSVVVGFQQLFGGRVVDLGDPRR